MAETEIPYQLSDKRMTLTPASIVSKTQGTDDVPDAPASPQLHARGLFVFPKFPAESFAAVELRALEPHLASMRILSVRGRPDTGAEDLAQLGFQRAGILHWTAGVGEYWKDFRYAFGKAWRFWPEMATALRENAAKPSHAVKTLGALAVALRVARLAGNGDFDFVYVFWGNYLSCCIPLLKRAAPDVRSIVFLGAYNLIDYPRGLKRWLRQADGIFTHFEGHVDEIRAILGGGATPPVFMIHRGIDLKSCSSLKSAPVSKEHDFCFVGRLHPEKGADDFVEALARLRRQGLTFTAVLVGDGPLRANLTALLAENDLSPTVHLLGQLPHGATLEVIRRAKILMLPSSREVYPNVVKEAMALDTACIAYDIPGLRAFNVRWPAVVLCAPDDIKGLVQVMDRLLHDCDSREALVLHGRRVVQSFDLTRTTRERLRRITGILRRNRGR